MFGRARQNSAAVSAARLGHLSVSRSAALRRKRPDSRALTSITDDVSGALTSPRRKQSLTYIRKTSQSECIAQQAILSRMALLTSGGTGRLR
ncbi:hypothetical protein BURKHO8Y_240245 [Burkholderia sp. 8Y]|nr:hypothetical protein BURKHO8Y_240245 [Burkholderia sp. 8Y]